MAKMMTTTTTTATRPRRVRKRKPTSGIPGHVSLFRGKVRAPVSITLTQRHHDKVNANRKRLGVTRADFLALLIEKYADQVELDPVHL
jgi:hypothetical protein